MDISDNEMKKLMNISLSDTEVMNLINNEGKLVLYPDMIKYKNINELLGPHGACVLLYESRPSYGHWCAVFKTNNPNEIEFFNSYGDSSKHEGFPDGTMKFIPEDFAKISNQNHTYLADLMYNSSYKLSYNQYIFQGEGKGIKTCGRHVACRLRMRNLSLDEYHKKIMSWCKELNITPDEVVTLWTTKYLN